MATLVFLDANAADLEPLEGGGVLTAFGRSGAVSAEEGDYTASQVANDSEIAGRGVSGALNTLEATKVDRTQRIEMGPGLLGGGALEGDVTIRIGTIDDAQHGARSGGTLHADATASASGFMPADAFRKVAGIQAGAAAVADNQPGNQVRVGGGAAGTQNTAARGDHGHDVLVAPPVPVGSTNAEGDATALARANHQHAGVTSFAGQQGIVVPRAGDYTSAMVTHTSGVTVADALTQNSDQASSAVQSKADKTVRIITPPGSGLAGGGDLTTDRTLGITGISDLQHGQRGGGDLHAEATTERSGFMTAEHVQRLEQAFGTSPPTPYDGAPARVTDDLDAVTPGTETMLSRGDHVHFHGALSGGDLHTPATSDDAGFMTPAFVDRIVNVAIVRTDAPVDPNAANKLVSTNAAGYIDSSLIVFPPGGGGGGAVQATDVVVDGEDNVQSVLDDVRARIDLLYSWTAFDVEGLDALAPTMADIGRVARVGDGQPYSFYVYCGFGNLGDNIGGPDGQVWRRIDQRATASSSGGTALTQDQIDRINAVYTTGVVAATDRTRLNAVGTLDAVGTTARDRINTIGTIDVVGTATRDKLNSIEPFATQNFIAEKTTPEPILAPRAAYLDSNLVGSAEELARADHTHTLDPAITRRYNFTFQTRADIFQGWTINHNLAAFPLVQVIVAGYVLQQWNETGTGDLADARLGLRYRLSIEHQGDMTSIVRLRMDGAAQTATVVLIG